MSYHTRRLAPQKRKERDATYRDAIYSSISSTLLDPSKLSEGKNLVKEDEQQLNSSNLLLAGCMAYEFLAKGTLFGQKFEPDSTESRRNILSQSQVRQSLEAEPIGKLKQDEYAEVANLLKSDDVHVPGVVNPTHLARWIQM